MWILAADEVFYFVREDLAALRERAEAAEARYKGLLAGSHESTSQSSETWHDNPAFDDVQQQSRMFFREYTKLKSLLDNSQVVEADAAQVDTVQIGDRVRVLVNDRVEFDVVVCSYRCFHESGDDIDYVSYIAPLASALLGKKEGERGTFSSGKTNSSVLVRRIFRAMAVK